MGSGLRRHLPRSSSGLIDRLAEFAEGARVLELAIGTGRVAIPLAERGIDVTGIDISDEMVAKLRAKAGGAEIPVVMSDFTEVSVEGSFRLVFLVFNTLFALEAQEDLVPVSAMLPRILMPAAVLYSRPSSRT